MQLKEIFPIKGEEKWLGVNWALMNSCNYRCDYCGPLLHNGSIPTPSLEVCKKFCKTVSDYARGKGLRPFFTFGGGELTYMKSFPDLIKYIHELGGMTSVISNGSSGLKWWQENLKYVQFVCLSYHPTQVRSEEAFINVSKLIAENENAYLQVNVMMAPTKFDECVEFAKKLKEVARGSISLQPIYANFGTGKPLEIYDYTDEQHKIMQEFRGHFIERDFPILRGSVEATFKDAQSKVFSTHEILVHGLTNFKGWTCYAGIDNIVVDFHGKIFRGWCGEEGDLGSIYDEQFTMPSHPVVCQQEICQCGFDICSRKTSPN